MTIYPDPKQCPCCIEGQRPGMYDDGKPASCGACAHLVSEHARVNRAVDPSSVAAAGTERVGEGSGGTPGAGTDAVLATDYTPAFNDPDTVERVARALIAVRLGHGMSELDVLRVWHKTLSERDREAYRAQARAAIAVLSEVSGFNNRAGEIRALEKALGAARENARIVRSEGRDQETCRHWSAVCGWL